MGFINQYPYSDTHELNLDWVIKEVKNLHESMISYQAANKVNFADPIDWDITKQYPQFTIVFDYDNQVAMMAKKPVPEGIPLSNSDYWELIGPITIDADARMVLDRILRFITNIYESGTTASATRYPGDYVVAGSNLYKVTAPITAGTSYTSGVNVSPITIETMIHEICSSFIGDVFPVGPNSLYTTIQAAYDAAVANHGGTILIYPGEYDEAITMTSGSDSYDIKFIGISREKSIWKSTTFGYANACFTGSGNLTFENLTMIKGDLNTVATEQGGYALHMDYPNTQGVMKCTDCTFISTENAAVGCGTRTNQELYFDNCLFITYCPASVSTNGALLYHTAPEADHTGQGFSLMNSVVLGLGSASASFCLFNSASNTESFDPVIINNRFMSDIFAQSPNALNYWEGIVSTSLVQTDSTLSLKVDKAFGNNNNAVNAVKEETTRQQTQTAVGTPFYLTDTLNPPINNGFIQIKSDATDTPVSGHSFHGFVMSLGSGWHFYCVTDDNSNVATTWVKVIQNNAVKVNWSYSNLNGVAAWGRTAHPVKYGAIGSLVNCTFTGLPANSTSYNIIDGYRPTFTIYSPCYIVNGSTKVLGMIEINTDGSYTVTRSDGVAITGNDAVYGNVSWFR